MKSDKIQSAIGKIDVDLIEAADRQEAFAKPDTLAAPMQPRGLSEAQKGGNNMKNRKPLRIALIAAVVVLLLAGTVTAAGIRGGWLLPALSNAGVDSELLEKVMHPAVSATVGNERWTVDELLIEGNTVFMQYTRESLDGSPLPHFPEDVHWTPYLLDEIGMRVSSVQGCTGYLTEETGDPTRRTQLLGFDFYLDGEEPDWENATLMLYLDNGSLFPRLMFSAPVGTPLYRSAALEDGTPVKLGRFTLELDPTGITRNMEACFGVILTDGTTVNGGTGAGIASPEQGLESGHTVQVTLTQIIDPNEVAALVIDGVRYPVS